MANVEKITFSLPENIVRLVEAKEASGEFDNADSGSDFEYFDHRIHAEIVRRHDELVANPEPEMSLEEVGLSVAKEFGDQIPEFRKTGLFGYAAFRMEDAV